MNNVLSAGSLKGNDVKNHLDEDLGDIKDFMIDTDTGQVSYAVLDFGGFLGIGNKLFAVPMAAMVLNKDDKCFVLNTTKEALKEARGFDQHNWPNMSDKTWQGDLNKFYKVNT